MLAKGPYWRRNRIVSGMYRSKYLSQSPVYSTLVRSSHYPLSWGQQLSYDFHIKELRAITDKFGPTMKIEKNVHGLIEQVYQNTQTRFSSPCFEFLDFLSNFYTSLKKANFLKTETLLIFTLMSDTLKIWMHVKWPKLYKPIE